MAVSHQRAQLNKLLPKPKKLDVHYLVSDDSKGKQDEPEESGEGECGATCGTDEVRASNHS